jgi:succinate-semialdehyde dehydrogenase / glutarate-semialdehyde dehydrogenase
MSEGRRPEGKTNSEGEVRRQRVSNLHERTFNSSVRVLSGMAFQTLSPATGQLSAAFPLHTPAEIERRMTAAASAAAPWAATVPADRAALLHALADALQARETELARLAALEMGKPLAQGRTEVQKCAATCRWLADHAPALLADEPLPDPTDGSPGQRFLMHDPLGIVLGVMPWNFPFWQVVRFAAPTLAAGNVVLVKHAPNVPQCASALEEIFQSVLPTGLYQDLRIEPDIVATLLADPRIAAVSLTGSERAGASVAATAGQNLKPAVLELGGSDAFVVLADADVAKAAEVAARSRLQNAGQSCIAAKRFIVEQAVFEEFTELMTQHLRAAIGGDPLAPNAPTDLGYGPLARVDLAQQLTKQVTKSVASGAKIALPGGQPAPDSAFFHPMVLVEGPLDCPAWAEEMFGPVAAIRAATDEADAIRLANTTTFGLGGTVWSRDPARAERVARALRCGYVTVNALTASTAELPFGGRGRSGWGRELGTLGVRAFTVSKTVVMTKA